MELVQELLAKARSRAPKHPDRLSDLAAAMTSGAELSAGIPAPLQKQLDDLKAAQKAIDTLRELLPPLIANAHMLSLAGADCAAQERSSAFRDSLVHMQMSLADTYTKPGGRLTPEALFSWQTVASWLLVEYRRCVGSGSTSKNGPAVRFIVLALERIGFGERSVGAVGSALDLQPVVQNDRDRK